MRPTGDSGRPAAIRVTIGWPHENDRFVQTLAEVLPDLPPASA